MVKKISIIGSGSVGSMLAFHILSGLDIKDLVLVDISGSLAKGIALDLEDTRGFLKFNTHVLGTSNINHIENSDIVVITCGIPRKEGMTRYDLFKTNSKIVIEVTRKIKRLAPTSLIVVVTNPLDAITYVVNKHSGFGRFRIMGMGSSLDSSRFLNLIYSETKISPYSIDTLVCGLHSKDMLPVTSCSNIKGNSLDAFLNQGKIEKITQRVKERGKEIVSFLKNRSASFAPSLSCYKLIEAIVKDKNEIIPVSVLLQGEYGLRDVCLGVPCVISRKGIDRIVKLCLSVEEKGFLKKMKSKFLECIR